MSDTPGQMFQTPAIICTGIGATRMYRRIFDRHSGDLLEYLESSRDAKTGEIRFRRQTISRVESDVDPCIASGSLPTDRVPRARNGPFMGRYAACEIHLERAVTESHVTEIDPDLVL